ncbi:UDP-glucuronic acid decarboxylase family protein [Burkholderia multivorans]|uniref:UDP-glucuronic acid decarboxylase family protein n=1 Tax=Burkholderia multivorans TaxID=87883 RepID=UPI001C216231|nr:UDP-glucuronic acid decarboxylase family protein [Burkholderia multivorans]MBU9365989.1 SDR family oxidoreductase [Burkholderia multivorans]
MNESNARPRRRVLVTGGAGFLGSHLCDRLLADGHEVLCLDNLQTGAMRNIRHLLQRPGFAWLRQDVTEPLSLDVDRIYNLACPASPVHYQADAIGTTRTCVLGAMQVLELAKRTGARVLQASTSEIYGDPLEHPQRETYHGNVNPVGPRACYDEGKRCAETLFTLYQRTGVSVRIARIFNTYGPRMAPNDGRVVSNFIVQALQGEPLTIYGDGTQTRSFCYVDDLIEGLVRLMESPHEDAGPVNLGNPQEMTMLEIAERISDAVGAPAQLVFRPLPGDDPARRRPDITRARRLLRWQPAVAPAEGLARTVRYFAQELGRGRRGAATNPAAAAR